MDQNAYSAGSVAGTVTGEHLKQQAQAAVEQGQQIAGQVVDKARDQVKSQAATQKDRVSSALEDVAQALLLTSRQLRTQGQDHIGNYGDRAAEQVTRASTYLKQRDLDQVVREAADFTRSRPALVVGTAVTLGVLLARFLKSSAQNVAPDRSHALVPYQDGYPGTGLPPVPETDDGLAAFSSPAVPPMGNVSAGGPFGMDADDLVEAPGVRPTDGL